MQFKLATLTTLAVAVATFAPAALAQAISCYSKSGCPHCETEDSMYAARQDFCSSNDWSHSSYLNRGVAHVTLDGAFETQQDCWDSFHELITQCYSYEDGGVSTNYYAGGQTARLDVRFCNCE
ncbi:hypothetical protein GY45DRAFT_1439293 [Cubamyces sp. BRFM 1775]|nr:hypothetical protein GY45DRAFT_1439293 [Cubamyces sp. BRFM 1775]